MGILKNSVSRVETCLGRRWLTFACSRKPWADVTWDGGGPQMKKPEWKECVSLSLCWRTFKLKGNKNFFLPELRSRKCFSCFEISMFYLYGHSMYVSHIAISWLWYKNSIKFFLKRNNFSLTIFFKIQNQQLKPKNNGITIFILVWQTRMKKQTETSCNGNVSWKTNFKKIQLSWVPFLFYLLLFIIRTNYSKLFSFLANIQPYICHMNWD